MKKTVLFLSLVLAALLLCACGEKPPQGEWTMPVLESAPTAAPKDVQAWGGSNPERYIWNEAQSFDMSDPGVTVTAYPKNISHSESLALFGGQFLPKTIFGESHGAYERMYLEQVSHDVLLDESGALAENAYVEYRYLNKAWVENKSISVMAELCSYDRVMEIYSSRLYPHIVCMDAAKPQMSGYYLSSFVLARCGGLRCAQWLVLPDNYFSYVDRLKSVCAELDMEPEIKPLVLLTFTCREDVSDEQFIAAVCAISQASQTSVVLPNPDTLKMPKPGEKGYA